MTYSAPSYIALELTGDCNLNCKHCYGNFPRKQEGEFTTQEICDLIDELYKFGVFRLELGGGEPSLRDDFIEILRFANQYPDLNLTIVTNGCSWTEKDIVEVASLTKNKKMIHLSMDGYDPDSYSILRRNKKAFQKALETTKLMLKHGIDVRWNYAVGKKTYKNLKRTINLAKELGVRHIRLMLLYNTGRAAAEQEMGFNYTEFQQFMVDYVEDISVNSPVSVSLALTQPFEYFVPLMEKGYSKEDVFRRIPNAASYLDDKNYKSQTDFACSAGRLQSAISPTGDMFFCCVLSCRPEFAGGNVFETSLPDIWNNSPMYKWIRNLRLKDLNTDCDECKYKHICGGGCRARALFSSGDFLGPDPLCPFVSKKQKENVPIPFIDKTPIDEVRSIIKSDSIETFSVEYNGNVIRVRPEEFGASLYIPDHSYLDVNNYGFEILESIYKLKSKSKAINFLTQKYNVSKKKMEDIVDSFLTNIVTSSK